MVTITSKQYIEGYGWDVQCIVDYRGRRSGSEFVDLPSDATDDQLAAAILKAYGKP